MWGRKVDTVSPAGSIEKESYPQNYPGANGYEDGSGSDVQYDDDLHVACPPHTTERKLVRKIDLHVVPFLCLLYLLAFLDR